MRLFVTWAGHARRSTELGKRFSALPVFIFPGETRGLAATAWRYLRSFVATLRLFARERPTLVFVLNQPVFLVLAAYLYSHVRRCPYVIDHHSGAFNYRQAKWSLPLLRLLCRHASLSIVTNPHHAEILRGWGCRVRVIADVPFDFAMREEGPPLDEIPAAGSFRERRSDRSSVVMVSTFSRDEPLEAVLEAARRLPEVDFYVTGSLKRADKRLLVRAPLNVTFTDFLPDRDYVALLRTSQAVLALTTRDHTLQRGAYEALSLGRPIITSDWPLLREVFCRGAVYTRNDARSIEGAIQSTLQREDQLASQVRDLRAERRNRFESLAGELENLFQRAESVQIGVTT